MTQAATLAEIVGDMAQRARSASYSLATLATERKKRRAGSDG